jgi:hypothetical protein
MPNLRNLLRALLALTLVPLAAPVQAGIIFVPVGNVVSVSPGNSTIRQLSGGRYLLRTQGLSLTGTVNCNGDPGCEEAGLGGASVDLAQDLRIVIDFTGAGIAGQTRGDVLLPPSSTSLPDTVKFQGPIDGKLKCEPNSQRACATATILVRAQAGLTDEADGALAGIMELEWVGAIQPQIGAVAWDGLFGLGDIVMFTADDGDTLDLCCE